MPYFDYFRESKNLDEVIKEICIFSGENQDFDEISSKLNLDMHLPKSLLDYLFIRDDYKDYIDWYFTYVSQLTDFIIQWIALDGHFFPDPVMEKYEIFIWNLYRNQLKYPTDQVKFDSLQDFYEAYLKQKDTIEKSVGEIVENYFIVASFFHAKKVFYDIINNVRFEMTNQRLKFFLFFNEDEKNLKIIECIQKNPKRIPDFFLFSKNFCEMCKIYGIQDSNYERFFSHLRELRKFYNPK